MTDHMMKLIIFGGTSEGRELAVWAAGRGFSVILCVATDYGEALCPSGKGLDVRKGRLDAAGMSALFEEEQPQLIIDATHPHAAAVSANIRNAAERQEIELIRVTRPEAEYQKDDRYSDWEKDSVRIVSSAAEAIKYLGQDDKPVLLTTGSKEIQEFSSLPDFADRVYARVLPQNDAISACMKAGLTGSHIIAMQGPFTVEMNLAIINSVGAGWLVTKESGERGGYPEKMEASARRGIRVIVIKRPAEEDGLSLEETEKRLLIKNRQFLMNDTITERNTEDESARQVTVTLIGLGMGGGSQLTIEAVRALRSASVIFGADRMLEDIRSCTNDTPLVNLYRPDDVFAYLDGHPGLKKACVVFSGDTGFYSGCAGYTVRDDSRDVRILPGISSFSCLSSRFGLREEEFTPASAHGRDADAVDLLNRYGKVFLLLDPANTIGTVCRALTLEGYGDTFIYAGVRLGYPDEELFSGEAKDFTDRDHDTLAVMAMERAGTKGVKRRHA